VISKVFLALVGVNVWAALAPLGASIWDHVDIWAPVANTALLVVLALLQRQTGRKVDDTHESVHAAARTAAAAAECAEASARITKELGGALRGGTLPSISPQEQS